MVTSEDIKKALRTWVHGRVEDNPLADLQLFKQALRQGSGSQSQAIDHILSNALDKLAAIHEPSASILRRRFQDATPVKNVAFEDSIGQSTVYRKQSQAIAQLVSIIDAAEAQAVETYQADLEQRLHLPAHIKLSGVQDQIDHTQAQLVDPNGPWIISIEGLGGIGKTALANAVLRQSVLAGHFTETAWATAKQREYVPGVGLTESAQPALTVDGLVDVLLKQLASDSFADQSSADRLATVKQLLKERPYLIVVDNLETVTDYQALLPILQELSNPSKILLTSRHSLYGHQGVYCITLDALSQEASFDLIREEAKSPQLVALASANEADWQRIFDAVGGNPLALKLVTGQTAFLPLANVLDNLIEAKGKDNADLYSHIYWQAWHMMDDASRQALLIMPLTHDGTFDQLQANSKLEPSELGQALKQLSTLSLIQISGSLNKRRYSIHRLTETFLLNEAIRWQSLN